MSDKRMIYVDCDDTVLYSSEAVIRILNKRYGTNKTIDDLSDWGYKTIAPVTEAQVLNIYDSDEFWNEVEINQQFLEVLRKRRNDFDWVILSRGTRKNIEQKKRFCKEHFGLEVIGLGIVSSEDGYMPKTEFSLKGGILIDDNTGCVNGTDASLKILLRHGREYSWNQVPVNEDNLYAVNTWREIDEVLGFFLKHDELICGCYEAEE